MLLLSASAKIAARGRGSAVYSTLRKSSQMDRCMVIDLDYPAPSTASISSTCEFSQTETISLDLVQDITEDQENIEEKKKKKQLVMIKVATILLQLRKII